MSRHARLVAAHRISVLLAIALLLNQFITPVLHELTTHSRTSTTIAAQSGARIAVSAAPNSTDDHDPSTCAICQSIHQHRAGFSAPSLTAWIESSAYRFVANGAESFVTPRPSLSSAPPRGPPSIA